MYNPGEHVEGYTSFLFTAGVAMFSRGGLSPPLAAQLLGALSGVGLLAAAVTLTRCLSIHRSTISTVVLVVLLAMSSPVAAWTLGGLETPLFAALSTAAIVLFVSCDNVDLPSVRPWRMLPVGVVLGLATLARPEGAIFAAAIGLILWIGASRGLWRWHDLALLGLGYAALVLPHEVWRWWYYGYPLPNTFYVKSTGNAGELWARGLRYGELAFREMNPTLIVLGAIGLILPGRSQREIAGLWVMRITIPISVLYVLRIGGDFLDLYRFFVPSWVLLLVAAVRLLQRLEEVLHKWVSPNTSTVVAGALGTLLSLFHAHHQLLLGQRALQIAEPERAARHLEPLGWTREYALRWAAVGRWIADYAGPGDTMAIGAAGALPYFARIPNLDLFGLCDEYIAHHGQQIGTRPGHQRFAPQSYILQKNPTFLILNAEAVGFTPSVLTPDPIWNPRGWVWAEAITDPVRHGYSRPLHLRFLLQRDRAIQLRGSAGIHVAEDNPR